MSVQVDCPVAVLNVHVKQLACPVNGLKVCVGQFLQSSELSCFVASSVASSKYLPMEHAVHVDPAVLEDW